MDPVVILLVGGVAVGVAIGFFFRSWWTLPAVTIIGIVAIVVDITTRDLTSGGHDDRPIVAAIEAVILASTLGAVVFGRRLGARRRR